MPELWGADWWEAAQAVGTVGATAVAVVLALAAGIQARRTEKQRVKDQESNAKAEKRSSATLVSAWIETELHPSSDGTHYVRKALIHVANESNAPVFDVHVVVGVSRPLIQVGPLAVPVPIPTLPPARHRSWDISLGIAAYGGGLQLPSEPIARLEFSDADGHRWVRDFDGALQLKSVEDEASAPEEKGDPRQVEASNGLNPVWTVVQFVSLITREDPPVKLSELAPLLAENASGWNELDDASVQSWGDELGDFGVGAYVSYPAPQVAYVRLLHEGDRANNVGAGGSAEVRVQYVTLVFYPGEGWRVFSLGGGVTHPDRIEFPPGSISDDPWEPTN
ncbi:hypothetical protein [Nesterenkonia sp. HG001]|uniref:hypothetical protein n=1 Tax=Nesterenkonia sp. HG001 TaxID=2983207 RepID=UPI002AC67084|nr:hypothetical protein [Nesterenkonia sp. HG001]MDZ5077851.1 hypothetical protein [Nesterenkonia sp. HG001]